MNIIKDIEWNGHNYRFGLDTKSTGAANHEYITMVDDEGNEIVGDEMWINRPWHRFTAEHAWVQVVAKAFGEKAVKLATEINKDAYSAEEAIEEFFAKFDPKDIEKPVEMETTDDARKLALAGYLNVDPEDISEEGDNEFTYDDSTYKVLTDDEADVAYDEAVRAIWDALGIDGVSGDVRDWIFDNALNDDEEAHEEEVRDYIADNVYGSDDDEVVDKCIEEGILEDDGDNYIDGDVNYDKIGDMDTLRDKLIDKLVEDEVGSQTYVEYLKDVGYDDADIVEKCGIDDEAVIDYLKDAILIDGTRGTELASYDGEEIDLGNGWFAYLVG